MTSGERFDRLRHLTRADLKVVRARDGRLLLKLRMRVLKGRVLTGKTCTVLVGEGGKLLDAVREVVEYLQMDPVSEEDQRRRRRRPSSAMQTARPSAGTTWRRW